MDGLTYIALQQRFSEKAQQVKLWSLFYGDNKTSWFGPAPYAHCAAEKKRLLQAGMGYKTELFKIK